MWWSRIPPISTKWTITSHLSSLITKCPWYITFKIQVLSRDRHTDVVGLNQWMGPTPSHLDNYPWVLCICHRSKKTFKHKMKRLKISKITFSRYIHLLHCPQQMFIIMRYLCYILCTFQNMKNMWLWELKLFHR